MIWGYKPPFILPIGFKSLGPGHNRIGETKTKQRALGICAGSTGMVVLQDPGSSIGKCI